MSPPFLVKPVFLDRLFFIYVRRSSAAPRVAAFFFRNLSLKNEGFFVFYMSGAVRLGLGSPPFLVKPVFLDRLFFIYVRRSSATASGRRLFFSISSNWFADKILTRDA